MSSILNRAGERRERVWPRHTRVEPSASVTTDCSACGALWRVHRDLAGFRLRCDCEAWVAVPPILRRGQPRIGTARAAELGTGAEAAVAAPAAAPPAPSREPAHRTDDLDFEGDADESAGLFTSLVLMALAIAPWFFLGGALDGELVSYQPWAALAGSLMALVVGFAAWPRVMFAEPQTLRVRHVAEAIGVALAAYGLLATTSTGLADSFRAPVELLGAGWSLFLCALGPAVFEELAFRGLIQGRLTQRLGTGLGVVAAGFAFAFAHGIGPALPVMAGAGIYLGWLRERSESLVPSMVARLALGSALVLAPLV